MDREALITILMGISPRMRALVADAVTRILALAYQYIDFIEGEFRFEDFPDLDAEVNAILRELSDRGLALARQLIREALDLLEDEGLDYDGIISEVEDDGNGALWAFDLHASNLKKFLEGWITIGVMQNLTQSALLAKVLGYMDAPQDAPVWREAVRLHQIDANEYHFGRGYQRNIPNALKILATYLVLKAAVKGEYLKERADGATYWVRHRGSTFDCAECDAECEIPYPIDIEPYPLHPNCLCYYEYFYEPLP